MFNTVRRCGLWLVGSVLAVLGSGGLVHAQFASANMELLAQVPVGATGFDIWGWTDAQTSTEYAVIGHGDGVDFFDLTVPEQPRFVGRWGGHTGFDVKIYNDYAYAVNGGGSGSMQILNLSQLRGVTSPQNFTSSSSFAPSYHNIFINEITGYAYGSDGYVGVIDLQDPLHPSLVDTIGGGGHDAMSVIYHGPDARYAGQEVLIASQEGRLGFYNVDDKSSIDSIWSGSYPGRNYVHQSWLSEDHQFLFIGDELDSSAGGTRTHVMDVSDLQNPQYIGYHSGTTGAIDHNQYVKGRLLYQANYTAGVQVLRVDDPATLDMTQIAFLDTYPNNDGYSFNGAFTVYPYFESGLLIASDLNRGLFVMRLDLGNDADFNDDGSLNCLDVDDLVGEIATSGHDPSFDLTNDGLVTERDLDEWLLQANILPGDANLDGSVDGSDFNLWNEQKFTATAAWCQADFNADGLTDGTDFGIWSSHKFSNATTAVPEPVFVPSLALGVWPAEKGATVALLLFRWQFRRLATCSSRGCSLRPFG